MSDDPTVAAHARSTHAREVLADSLAELKQRLLPKTIARNLVQGVSAKGNDAAQAGTAAVKAHPGVAAGLAALAALFFARKPIIRAISSDDEATEPAATRSPD